MKKKEYFVLDYNEMDKLVNTNISAANGKYEFCAEQESPNDVCYSYSVSKSDIDRSYNQKSFKEIEDGNLKYKGPFYLLLYMVKLGVIEQGNYLIEVSW